MQYGLTRTALTAAGASLLGLCALAPAPAAADHQTFRVDIAMIGPTFHDFEANPDPARAGIPPNGSPFIIQGYIYRGGTFDRYGDLSGVLPDGSPEFPERVIGKWICRGWHLQDGDAVTGPVVATTQIFDLDLNEPGRHTLISEGIELADFDVAFRRAVTGGTGVFSRASGELLQTYEWEEPEFLNASGGFNTSFEFRLQQALTLPMSVFR
jgi:hypothetical protein